jgi:hypothetical protein
MVDQRSAVGGQLAAVSRQVSTMRDQRSEETGSDAGADHVP